MSASHMKISEVHSFETIRTTRLELEQLQSSPLPGAPLVSFDLHFDNLKDFLNSVSQTVNHHGTLIKTLAEELRTRVSTSELIEIFGLAERSITDKLGSAGRDRSGDDFKDAVYAFADKIKILSDNVLDLKQFKFATETSITNINEDLEKKITKNEAKSMTKKVKSKVEKTIREKSEELRKQMLQGDHKLSEKIAEIEKKLSDLELNTLWKIKDCEELLKVRVNEKYVHDAIRGIEDKLRNELITFNEESMAKYEIMLKDLQRGFEKNEHDFANKLKGIKEDVKDLSEILKKKSDFDNCSKEISSIKEILQNINLAEFHGKFLEMDLKISKFDEKIREIVGKFVNETSNEDVEYLKRMIEILKQQLENKADISVIQEILAKNQEKSSISTLPPIQEKSEMNEFWKFREKMIEQIHILESKVEKLGKNSDLSSIKKLLNSKAGEEDMKNELGARDARLGDLENGISQNMKDLDHLYSLLKKLQASLFEMNSRSGYALVGRKTFMPANCLSCGRGDANFSPIHPHVVGRDGKVYKADGVVKGPSISYAELENYQTGADVFTIDTHEQFHHKTAWEEDESPPSNVSRSQKTAINIVVNRELQKSSSTLPSTIKKPRPLSAKK
ncbi:unnamed protein product [Blepharisma stoltei]|uniref:Uncharacterized protein n=1 Tax=Blepharisma stoltei TaxID=1481888 RepID=A0AAU9IM62_9CILI|nr:unnamed protein product [Blepharisma stoltei]